MTTVLRLQALQLQVVFADGATKTAVGRLHWCREVRSKGHCGL